jgi:parallel beta-helix repeat protein
MACEVDCTSSGLAFLALMAALAFAPDSATARVFDVSFEDFEESLREALVAAGPGDEIVMPEGRFELGRSLVIATSEVVLRGQGREKTLLDFGDQSTGGQSILVVADRVELRDFGVIDPPTDGVVARLVDGVRMLGLSVEWGSGHPSTHGGYGIYPVGSANVEVRDCHVRGASEAGIYVGQSRDGAVEGNTLEGNLIGIDIENSVSIRVVSNHVAGNSLGVVIAARPDVSTPIARRFEIVSNVIESNNLANFSGAAGYLSALASGAGVMVVSAADTSIRSNRFADHDVGHVVLLNYDTVMPPMEGGRGRGLNLGTTRLSQNALRESTRSRPPLSRRIARWDVGSPQDVVWDGVPSSLPLRIEPPPPVCAEGGFAGRAVRASLRGESDIVQLHVVPQCDGRAR